MNALIENLQGLVKAMEAGSYNAAPSTLTQGPALQVEDLSPVMHNVTFGEEHLKLQKVLKVESCKSTLAQFDRQLSYGQFGGSAQLEGAVGMEETSDFVRVVVPMAFYSHLRNVTLVSTLVQTIDGKKSDERAAEDAAKKIAGDVEFDLFRGKADFSNAGVFDGNPLAIPNLPNMLGLDAQIRASDYQTNAKDLMFDEYGSNLSIVLPVGDFLNPTVIEDAHVRSTMNMGEAKRLIVDPLVLSAYNKQVLGYGAATGTIQRIQVGSTPEASGGDFRKQHTSNGVVDLEASRFLSGKTTWARTRPQAPAAPAVPTFGADGAGAVAAGTYYYVATACNEAGESAPSPISAGRTIAAAASITVNIPAVAGAKYFNVYRGVVNKQGACRFIGRVAAKSDSTGVFVDAGNKVPGFVTGFLLQTDTAGVRELAPYSRMKMAQSQLALPEAHFRFLCLAVYQPRKNVLLDSLKGSLAIA
jgi:hypothetical protein